MSRSEKMKKKYSIGLDIGVASVGWVCLREDYSIPKFNGRYAIGVREFDAAETAESTRILRGTRRRYNRRIKRIQLLQQTLQPLFYNDPGFFMKMDESNKHFWRNSNNFENNTLSETLKYLGENPRKYPTIYHLRNALIHEKQKFHPRLIYLALHNLVKFRGHFLNENLNWSDRNQAISLEELLKNFFQELNNHGYEGMYDEKDFFIAKQIFENNEMTNTDKRNKLKKLFGKEYHQPISLLLGLKTDLSQLFYESENKEIYKEDNLKLSFTEEDITEVYEKLSEEEKHLIDLANIIYQSILLKDLLGDSSCIAEAKVKAYEQFKEDLKLLKEIYNKFLSETEYRKMFITTKSNKNKYDESKDINHLCEFDKFQMSYDYQDKFFKNLLKTLNTILKRTSLLENDRTMIENVIYRINRDQFLQKLKNKINAAIPHQNNLFEADKILRNQQQFYPEITDDMIEKVKQIIRFRIPYYIGPLIKQSEQSEFGWLVRKNDGNITPWTFDKIVNLSESAEKFIDRMTSFCTYLVNEKVLPKHSLLYQKFEVLNELNGVQIRSSSELPDKKFRLDREVKSWIMENVFKKYKNVTHNILKKELLKSPYKDVIMDRNTDDLKGIYGTQKEDRFSSSLSTYIDMKNILDDIELENNEMIEEIIYWITVFEEKDILEMKIKEKYSHFSSEQIKRLVQLNYSGWGRLSRKLLDEIPANPQHHETIIELMEREPLVFMEVMSNPAFHLDERIAKINQKDNDKFIRISYQDIKDLQGSPALKKAIWQAVQIIEELVDIFGEPENIMIEFAREEGVKGRTVSRKKQLEDMYRAISNDEKELKAFLKEHSRYDEADYRDNRLYLYVTQQGKCLYSGEALDISRLQDYDVDHILPRSFVKDDSLDNLALVKKKMNNKKGDLKMPLEILDSSTRAKQKMFWKRLYENKLISQRKYQRLMKEKFTDQDKESFIARQLVETRQITKHVKNLLEERFPNTKIHTVNADIISKLREHTNTFKIRELNNKHHAVDAALAALIVQFILNQYGNNFLDFSFRHREATKKWRNLLVTYGKNFFLFSDIDKYDKFIHYETGELLSGRQYLQMLNNEIPWQTTKRLGTNEAAFYDQTIYSPKSTKGRNPKYKSGKLHKGVHSDVKVDSSFIISYKYLDNKNKEKVNSTIVNLNVIEKYQTRGYSEKQLAIFLADKVAKGKVLDATIHKRILKHQLCIIEDHPLYYVSDKELNNAKQLQLPSDLVNRLYHALNEKNDLELSEYKELFTNLADEVLLQFNNYFPESRIHAISNYAQEIKEKGDFIKGVKELFKATNAGPARSDIFGGRYERRLKPNDAKFVYQSITGLRYRKPKSYKKELWLR